MPTAIDARNALKARLQAMPGRPSLAYRNGPLVETLPRIVIQEPNGFQNPLTHGGSCVGRAEIVARVETEDGTLDTQANQIASAIVAHFPANLALATGIKIRQAREGGPYQSGGVYHLPVTIEATYIT